jgi:hypothetical protein
VARRVCNQLNLAPGLFCTALRTIRERLKNPPVTAAEYVATLTRQELVAAAAELQQFAELI